jgi:DNA-binding transcriptional LysR family regulator
MRFKGLDLNLLVAFDALLRERSVSRAAEKLHITQPAMSAALGRLREFFGDELFIPHGRRLHLTTLAQSLAPHIAELLGTAETMIETSTTFDPLTSQRSFRIVASDYITAVALVPLVARLEEISPNVRLDIFGTTDAAQRQLDEGLVDLLLTPREFAAEGHPAELLFTERHVVVGWAGNPLFDQGIDEEAFFASDHIAVAFGTSRISSFADRHVDAMDRPRRIAVTSTSFTTVPWLLIGTMRLALLHERLVRSMRRYFPIRYAPVPFEFPLMEELIQYHSARVRDDGLAWIRKQLHEVVAGDS